MNIPSKLDTLHGFYGKVRYTFLIVFSCSIVMLSLLSHTAYGESVVGTVQTRITVKIDDKSRNIMTTQNNIDAALKQNDIVLEKNDITEPPLGTYLSGKTMDVDVIRAIPVLITDGSQSWEGKSAYKQPGDILKQLAVEVFPEDKISAELILDPAAVGMVGQNVIIDRAPVYTIYVDDKTMVARSWTTNVSDLLAEKGISLGVNDIVEPAKATALTGVSELTVTRINYADVEEIVTIPYQTINQNDNNMYRGKSTVTQNGINGSKKQSVHIVYKNGIEVERTITSTEVTQAAQNKVVSIGVKPYSHQDLWAIMVQAQETYGVSASNLYSVAVCEAGADPGKNTGNGYYGMYQWDGSFYNWAVSAGFSGTDKFDPYAQIFATALRVKSSKGSWSAWPTCGAGLYY